MSQYPDIISVLGIFETNWNLVSADIFLIILPVIVVYLMGQRYIISRMTSRAVKG